jgi:hypothetical protein
MKKDKPIVCNNILDISICWMYAISIYSNQINKDRRDMKTPKENPTIIYTDHDQLSSLTIDYIMSCADAKHITEIPIEHINEFLQLQEED